MPISIRNLISAILSVSMGDVSPGIPYIEQLHKKVKGEISLWVKKEQLKI